MDFPMIIGEKEVNSVRELRELAEYDTEAQMILGQAFWEGDEVPQDYKKAFSYFEKAAENNDSQALINLGFMYQKGIGCEVDLLKAEKYYLEADFLEDDEANKILAEVYIFGMGPVKQDLKKGLEYARKAIEIDGDDARELIGWLGGKESFEQIYFGIMNDVLSENDYRKLCQMLREDQPKEYLKYEPAGLYD